MARKKKKSTVPFVLRLLAWLTLSSAVLFSILAVVAVFVMRPEDHLAGFVNEAPKAIEEFELSQMIGFWSTVVLLSLSLVLVVAILITSCFVSPPESDS
jgi:hypothetical protein